MFHDISKYVSAQWLNMHYITEIERLMWEFCGHKPEYRTPRGIKERILRTRQNVIGVGNYKE